MRFDPTKIFIKPDATVGGVGGHTPTIPPKKPVKGGSNSGSNIDGAAIGNQLTGTLNNIPGLQAENTEAGDIAKAITDAALSIVQIFAGQTDKNDATKAGTEASKTGTEDQNLIKKQSETLGSAMNGALQSIIDQSSSIIDNLVGTITQTIEDSQNKNEEINNQKQERDKLSEENEEIAQQLKDLGINADDIKTQISEAKDSKKSDGTENEHSKNNNLIPSPLNNEAQQKAFDLINQFTNNQQNIIAIDQSIANFSSDISENIETATATNEELGTTVETQTAEIDAASEQLIEQGVSKLGNVTQGLLSGQENQSIANYIKMGGDATSGIAALALAKIPIFGSADKEQKAQEQINAGATRGKDQAINIANKMKEMALTKAEQMIIQTMMQQLKNVAGEDFAALFDQASSLINEVTPELNKAILDGGGGDKKNKPATA